LLSRAVLCVRRRCGAHVGRQRFSCTKTDRRVPGMATGRTGGRDREGGRGMSDSRPLLVDVDELREQVREKYRAVAVAPAAAYHFHTGRPLAARLGYDAAIVDALPDAAVE